MRSVHRHGSKIAAIGTSHDADRKQHLCSIFVLLNQGYGWPINHQYVLRSPSQKPYEVIASRVRVGFILLEITRDRAVLQMGGLGVWGLTHHEQEGCDDCDHE